MEALPSGQSSRCLGQKLRGLVVVSVIDQSERTVEGRGRTGRRRSRSR